MNLPARKFPEEITAATVAWLELRDQGQFEGPREEEFLAWLEADPRHLEAFEEFDRVWSSLDRIKSEQPARAAVEATMPPDHTAPLARRRVRPLVFASISLAAAAAVAIGFFLFPRTDSAVPESVRFASTQADETKTLHLPDGSLVRLDPATQVTVDYRDSARNLRLAQGSAHFAVAKDPARPFVVAAGGVSVRAVGTAFDVRLGSAAVEVQVTEGKVRVDDSASGTSLLPEDTPVNAQFSGPVLAAGQKVVIQTDPATLLPVRGVLGLSPVVAKSAVEMLEFDGTPLEQVVAEFNRRNRHQLVLVDEQLKAQQFTGKFRADGYEGLVRLLQTSFGIQVEERSGETLLRAPAGIAPAH